MATWTRNDLIGHATTEYIKGLDPSNLPTPEEAQRELVAAVQDLVDGINSQRDKKHQMQQFTRLIPRQIAELMMVFHRVVRLTFMGRKGSEYDTLAVYVEDGPEKGTYVMDTAVLHNLAAGFCYDIEEKGLKEVDSILMRTASRVGVCQERNLIAVGNGIFDFDAKKLLPFTPDKVFLSKSMVDYVDNPKSPVIHNAEDGTDWEVEAWMRELSDDEGVPELLWEIVGAVIRPNVSWDKSAWLYSEQGNNGKGTLCHLMRQLCGEGYSVSLPIADMGKDFMLEQIIGKSAIITDENDVGTFVERGANLKALITGDSIMVNRKGKPAITYRFRGFMVQCLNELPRVRDRSDSMHRRQLFIPFRKCFTGMERKYIKHEYLERKDVLEYVLWRVLNMDYYELSTPPACREALDDYKLYNDPVKQFVEDVFPRLQWDVVPISFLYSIYKEWFRKCNPSGSLSAEASFRMAIVAESAGMDEWEYKRTVTVHSRMDAPEPLLLEYGIMTYAGEDVRLYGGRNTAKRLAMMQSNTPQSVRHALVRQKQRNRGWQSPSDSLGEAMDAES